ncbi:MAG: ABC transporter permease [Clostridiales Family XIII bacterium]|jgi:peptide/nickel transport system permease protein|nr:ABC transporter permease [Clostridiales Family XIII bacterium]
MNAKGGSPGTDGAVGRSGLRTRIGAGYWGGVFLRLAKNKPAIVALSFLCAVAIACVLVPVFSPYTVEQTNFAAAYAPPGGAHPLGADKLGRDLFLRLFYGGRISLGIALAVTFSQTVLGVLLGSLAGYYRGAADAVIMRVADVFYSFPLMMMAITMVAILGSGSVQTLIITLTLLTWPGIARIVRGQILTLREQEYMEACEALGIRDSSRILRHLLPNVLAYVIVYATMGMANALLVETSLSFLGLGVSPPTPTWGNMINEARNLLVVLGKWWLWVPPGLCIFLSVMCFNLLGDGLRDAVDPKMKR